MRIEKTPQALLQWAATLLWLSLFLVAGCKKNVVGGQPAMALSNTNGTSCVYMVTEQVLMTAITNVFEPEGEFGPSPYRGMALEPPDPSFLGKNSLRPIV